MKKYLLKHKYRLAGIVAGAALGYAYYYFIGCASGSCTITSNPVNSTLYGALMGLLIAPAPRKEPEHTKEHEHRNTY